MYSNIVVGTDGSGHALDAVRRAGELAQLLGLAAVHVVSAVVPNPSFTRDGVNSELDQAGDAAVRGRATDAHFAAAEGVLAEHDIVATRHTAVGDPSNVILDVADDVGAGLIVVGARGLRPLQRFLRGSVSTRIAQHARCDVLIVEHGDRE